VILLFGYTQVEAAKSGSEAEVKKLLDEGEDPDSHEDNKVAIIIMTISYINVYCNEHIYMHNNFSE
jgi:hypothetical protein